MPLSQIPIEELELGVRAFNILKRMGVDTCADLLEVSVQDLNAYTAATGVAFGFRSAMQVAAAQDYLRGCDHVA